MESVEQDGEQVNRDDLILQQQREIEREVRAAVHSRAEMTIHFRANRL